MNIHAVVADRRKKRDVIAASSWFAVPLCAILAAAVVYCFYVSENYSGRGEPFAWFEGISAWPSIAIILFAALLSIHFVIKTHFDLKKNWFNLTDEFGLEAAKPKKDKIFDKLDKPPFFAWRITQANLEEKIDIVALWQLYLWRGRFWMRALRAVPMTVLYMLALYVIRPLLGDLPDPPIRGDFPFLFLIVPTIIVFLILTFVVIDAILLHEGFLKQFAEKETDWPTATFERYNYPIHLTGNERDLADYWDILLIAKRTEAVGNQIYYPFVILSLLIVALLSYFDNWTWSPVLIVPLCMHFSVALYAAWRLPKEARKYRDTVLERLKRRRRQALMLAEKRPEATDTMIEEVQSTHQGAFSYLWEQPAMRAILLPSGGIGLATLLQYLPH
jgi:hypothetical protein